VKIYIPGRGSVDSDVYKVDRAVNQYNDRLSFEFNEAGQDYCIFMRMPYPEEPVIILGLVRRCRILMRLVSVCGSLIL
jgi:hypothetical protein